MLLFTNITVVTRGDQADRAHGDTIIVAGRARMRDRQRLTLAEERLCAGSRNLTARRWLRA